MIGGEHNIDELLAPQNFKREHYTAHLYAPYSIKIGRRVYLYGHDKYDIWVNIESDPNIVNYNEIVAKVPVVISHNKAINISPAFITLQNNKSIIFHTSIQDQSDPALAAWSSFTNSHGYVHRNWTKAQLNTDKIKISNYKKILRYTCMAGAIENYLLETKILSEITNYRTVIFSKIVNQFPITDPEEVKASLLRLIVRGKLHSDLHLRPFCMLTEVSAFHEFS